MVGRMECLMVDLLDYNEVGGLLQQEIVSDPLIQYGQRPPKGVGQRLNGNDGGAGFDRNGHEKNG